MSLTPARRRGAIVAVFAMTHAAAANADDHALRWDVDAREGFAASWSTAQSYLGFGSGLSAGLTFPVPVHVGIEATYHSGTRASAGNATIAYASRQWSTLTDVTAGYTFFLVARHLALRPEARLGAAFVADTTRLGDARRRELDVKPTVGPGLTALVCFQGFHAGLDGRAWYTPSPSAAPGAAMYLVFGVER